VCGCVSVCACVLWCKWLCGWVYICGCVCVRVCVCVQLHLPSQALRHAYDAVILAYGAADDKKLNIAGSEVAGVHSAREFVDWYNGAP